MLIDSGLGETLHFRVFARSLIDLSIMSFLIFDAFDVLKKRIPLWDGPAINNIILCCDWEKNEKKCFSEVVDKYQLQSRMVQLW